MRNTDSFGIVSLLQAEVLQNVYTDCTRLDEALKRGETIHSKDTESSKTNCYLPTDTANSEYNSSENTETSGAYWNSSDYYTGYNSYDYGQVWDYSENYQTEGCSTKDPYRETMNLNKEAHSDPSPTSHEPSLDPDSTKTSSSEPIPSTDRSTSEHDRVPEG